MSTENSKRAGGATDGDTRFKYQLLSRLKQDCDYYLGFGNRSKRRLLALDEAQQIAKMRELHSELPEKPVWLSLEDIKRYEAAMVGPGTQTQTLN